MEEGAEKASEHVSEELESSQMEEEVETPRVGMSFGSEEEVRSYYMKYGSKIGFGIRRACTKIGDDGKLKYFSFSCSRSRKPTYTSKNSFRLRPSMRTDCKAKINIVVGNDGRLVTSKVRLDHNHPLSPGKAQHVRYNKKTEAQLKGITELSGKDAIGVKENLHYIASATQLRLAVGDAQAIQNFFIQMQEKNENFFYVMDLNEDGGLRNVYWADSRSRAAYEAFGDIILFDTTFLTNQYNLPFVAFFGVNHHGHSILLGCGLLSSEDTETYVWLFKSWLTCMSGHTPQGIITEGSEAIQGAVSMVFPKTRHRLCLWHIMKRMPENLEGLGQCQVIKKVMKTIVYESLRPNEFEESWGKMIDEYNLVNNEWLKSLYEDRHHWVPVYVRDNFWAGIPMTQCCENMNGFFDGFVNSKTTLKQFLEQYDNVLRNKVEKENKADTTSSNTSIPLFSDVYMEKQFREAYTHEMFKLFQDELKGLLYCNTSLVKTDKSISSYEVIDSVKVKDDAPRKEVAFDVLCNEVHCEVRCLCRLFEFRGILCRHAVAVLIKRNIHEIPPHYILSRWRKDIRRRHTLVKSSYDDFDSNPCMLRYDRLCKNLYQITELGADSDEKCKLLTEYLDEVKEKFLRNEWICLKSHLDVHLPPTKQKEPMMDQSTSRKKKKTVKGKQSQPGDEDVSHNDIGAQGTQVIPQGNLPHSWTLNTAASTNHRNFLQNHLEIYPDQPREMSFIEFSNNCNRWPNFNSGHLLQHGGFESGNTSDDRFMPRCSGIDHQNNNFGPTQTTNVDIVQRDPNLGTEQNLLDDATTL